MNCLIVGTGPSIKQATLPIDAEFVISVNTSIDFLPREPDIWFTLDPSSRNLDVIDRHKNKAEHCQFIVACRESTVLPDGVLRLKRISTHYEKPKDFYERWGCVPCLSEHGTDAIHTGNSVWGALQIAYWMEPKKIAILGLDGSQEPSYGSGHTPYALEHLPRLFGSSVGQLAMAKIETVVGSPESLVDCFPRMTPDQALEWINK